MEPEFESDDLGQKRVVIDQPKSRPLWQKILFIIIVLALIALALFGLSKLFGSSKKSSSGTKEATSSATESATASTTKTNKSTSNSCAPNSEFVNQDQGYQVCYPSGWVEKELKVSGLKVGFDPKKVDDTTATIVVEITDDSADLAIQNFNDNSSKFDFGTDSIDGLKVTQTTITRMKSDPLSATYPKSILTATTTHGRTYVATLNSTEADFSANQTIYTNFLKSWKFLDDIPKPPWSNSRNIIVDQPWTDSTVGNPVTISGEAITFEAVLNIRIKDAKGTTLKETTLQTQSGQDRSPFSGQVSFDKPKTSTGTIEVYTTSAKDNKEQDKVSIPVKFQ
ncbi:MAG TPA: Gmad2 immunoglobulin-like domain-containing protein [Candidatus Saccharimonadales bacterium]|nr:Gmad2 immunoglobulin-like domain-containing protein [Candidatus Saccharimonadales bacterium]